MIRKEHESSGSTPDPAAGEAGPIAGNPTPVAQPRFEIADVPIDEIRAELASRQRAIARLRREKARLQARVAEIDKQVAVLSGIAPEPAPAAVLPSPVRPPLSDLPLAEAIAKVFGICDEFTPAEAEQRLLEQGYSTRVASLRTSVTQVLSREMRFKRVARGRYLRTA